MSTSAPVKAKSNATTGPAKKLVIKPLKSKPELPSDFEESTWIKLQDAVDAVHCKRPVACSLEELYAAVQDMCMHKMSDKLYSRLQQACDTHVASQVLRLCDMLQLDPVLFLERVDAMWSDYCSQMLTIRLIFLYLDRTHVITSTSVRSLFDMGLQLLRRHLASHQEVERHTVGGLLALIERERQGEAVDRQLLKSILRMFDNLGTYAEVFQAPFLEQATMFYRKEGVRLRYELSVPAYLQHCETRLQEEYERCTQYLDTCTRKPLIALVERELVAAHIGALLERGFAELADAQRIEDLQRLYSLCARVSALDALRTTFREYIRTTGLKIVKDEEKDKDMVQSLLELKRRMDEVLERAMQRNEVFANTLKEAFESFINQRQNKPAELIAKFIDTKLRAGNKGQTDEELEGVLDKALMLFRYIQGKDVFEAFYKKDLAKRLLLGKSASIDAEKSMISKLKAECGSQFTTKLEGMFKDIELSTDVMAAFRQYESSLKKLPAGIDMQVSVLTSGYWPTYPIMEAKLPEELEVSQEVFKNFYLNKYSGRRLVWHASLGTCVLRTNFPKGQKELSVSLFQAVVLMLFNNTDSLSFEDVKSQSGIEDKELRRTLQSLACGKVRVLVKEPKGRDVEDKDLFSFNKDFSERLYRIKINSIQMKETEEENKKTNDQVLQDRQYQIDAAIVRIMKTRKQLSHKLLIAEVLQQLKFPLKAADLKKRIESLIDREYLARDNSDQNVYNYLA
mmetsp:Transcript_26924/g.58796  ORF Transcript_26924/g.58796 Transcript_26924/m.58796 type:complete len:739 (-) Transcript_26924:3390-5606(-)|eukprot:CAMPEP_0202898356 /NCGR_PEP_ID=MMETSP1392-20130828/6900_1 /ASSEMBLY_ACC=CAM_ASM_000868 /TAXON_ID=225041 /ORGANISM="Chlamydomonas chlamydogama, Strain SAG 11-48b" /LENGTH=738 /DNA_ID=CAMNT_0049584261 /DNA_START=62 /DNA_END=2278 /DNA_ORIENTATION=+